MTIIYYVTFAANLKGNHLHLRQCEKFLACVKAIEKPDALSAYNLINGVKYVPDLTAIFDALPHYHKKAFNRAIGFWYSSKGASLTLQDARGKLLGTIYAQHMESPL